MRERQKEESREGRSLDRREKKEGRRETGRQIGRGREGEKE